MSYVDYYRTLKRGCSPKNRLIMLSVSASFSVAVHTHFSLFFSHTVNLLIALTAELDLILTGGSTLDIKRFGLIL